MNLKVNFIDMYLFFYDKSPTLLTEGNILIRIPAIQFSLQVIIFFLTTNCFHCQISGVRDNVQCCNFLWTRLSLFLFFIRVVKYGSYVCECVCVYCFVVVVIKMAVYNETAK